MGKEEKSNIRQINSSDSVLYFITEYWFMNWMKYTDQFGSHGYRFRLVWICVLCLVLGGLCVCICIFVVFQGALFVGGLCLCLDDIYVLCC